MRTIITSVRIDQSQEKRLEAMHFIRYRTYIITRI